MREEDEGFSPGSFLRWTFPLPPSLDSSFSLFPALPFSLPASAFPLLIYRGRRQLWDIHAERKRSRSCFPTQSNINRPRTRSELVLASLLFFADSFFLSLFPLSGRTAKRRCFQTIGEPCVACRAMNQLCTFLDPPNKRKRPAPAAPPSGHSDVDSQQPKQSKSSSRPKQPKVEYNQNQYPIPQAPQHQEREEDSPMNGVAGPGPRTLGHLKNSFGAAGGGGSVSSNETRSPGSMSLLNRVSLGWSSAPPGSRRSTHAFFFAWYDEAD